MKETTVKVISKKAMTLEEAKTCVDGNGLVLRELDDKFKGNFDVVKLAVEDNGNALQYATSDLRDNEEIVFIAVNEEPDALEFASKKLRNNETIVQKAVCGAGRALEHASKEQKNNFDTVFMAVKWCGVAIQHASSILKEDPIILMTAIADSPGVVFNGIRVKNSKTVLKKFIPNFFKKDSDFSGVTKIIAEQKQSTQRTEVRDLYIEKCLEKETTHLKELEERMKVIIDTTSINPEEADATQSFTATM